MNPLYLDIVTSLGRGALKIAGTSIVAHGLMTADNWQTASGAIVTLIALVASAIQAKQANASYRAALNTPVPDAPVVAPATPANPTTGGLL